jgi:hypothetical protein
LLGYLPKQVIVECSQIPPFFLDVTRQPEVELEAYNEGAKILRAFFHEQLRDFYKDSLHPIGKKIIECCFDDGTADDYMTLLPSEHK